MNSGGEASFIVGKNQETKKIKLGDNPFLKSLTEGLFIWAGASPEKVITVVAVAGNYDDWAAYHETPCSGKRVAELGNKLPKDAATQIFPEWAKLLKWRP